MADDIRRAKELYDKDGFLKYVSTLEDAKAVMRHCSPGYSDSKIKACKEGIFLYGMCGVGVLSLLMSLTDLEQLFFSTSALIFSVCVLPFMVSFAVESYFIQEHREKNDAIMSGAYFEGKSEQQIIDEANQYVWVLNRLKVIEARIASMEWEERQLKR